MVEWVKCSAARGPFLLYQMIRFLPVPHWDAHGSARRRVKQGDAMGIMHPENEVIQGISEWAQ